LLPEKTFPTDADVPGKSDLLSILSQLPHVQEPVPATVMADDLSILSQLLPGGAPGDPDNIPRQALLSILSQLLLGEDLVLVGAAGDDHVHFQFFLSCCAEPELQRPEMATSAFNSFSVAAEVERRIAAADALISLSILSQLLQRGGALGQDVLGALSILSQLLQAKAARTVSDPEALFQFFLSCCKSAPSITAPSPRLLFQFFLSCCNWNM